jgi:hypothetical protein
VGNTDAVSVELTASTEPVETCSLVCAGATYDSDRYEDGVSTCCIGYGSSGSGTGSSSIDACGAGC